MKSLFACTVRGLCVGVIGGGCVLSALAQSISVQVGSPPPAPAPLVNHGDSWHYRKGTDEPQADWKTVVDAGLDGTWLTGPGGFGFADNDDATVLSDMLNGYNTVYIRRTFTIAAGVDPARRVMLTMDWDDGFVAYLDGVEVVRSPNVAVADPLHDSATVAGQNHEASNGENGNPPTTYDLGSVGSLLGPGTHVLAIHGLNAAPSSSDFSLIADLALTGGSQGTGGGSLFAIVSSATVPLSGTNSAPGATRVTVNGEPAAYNPITGEWSRSHGVSAGMNSLFVAALDATGAILASTNRDVLYEVASTTSSGVLNGDTVWDGANGTIHVTSTVTVPSGVTLRITNGAVVLLAPAASLRATTNGVILADGTSSKPVYFAPADGQTAWSEIGATGTNAALTLRHAEVVAGQIRPLNGGNVLLEDSVIRDMPVARSEVISSDFGGSLTLRRCYGTRFGEMDASETPVLIEDSLLEGFAVDGLDIKGTNVSLVVRRTTLRKADPENDNADGVDFGPGPGTVEGCLIYGFPDKGVSIGGAPGTRIKDTLIFDCGIGISAYSSTNLNFVNNTISRCAAGILFRNNPTPAVGVATNLIVWGNVANVIISNTSTFSVEFSDIEGGLPGTGNITSDPLFVNPAANDFHLAVGSPAIGSGLGGVNMGASYPVGGLPPQPLLLAALVTGTNEIRLVWVDDADNETGFEIERSLNGVDWGWLTGFGPNVTNHVDATAALGQRYFYRVRSFNSAGVSKYSNPASALRQDPVTYVGGTLTASTTWSPTLGTIVVASNLIVPTNVTLKVLPGTLVKITNNVSIRAVAGGVIDIAGTMDNKVRLIPLNGTNLWGQLSAQFPGSALTVRHAEIAYGQTTVYSNAVGWLEDSYFHDYRRAGGTLFTAPIILMHFAAPSVVRRSHVREYHETLFRNGVFTIEECLFENIHGDALDFDSALNGTVLRSSTFRNGQFGNVDAVDVGPGDVPGSFDVRIENCMMYNFPFDKGVSVGDNNSSRNTVVSNCFIYACLSGVQAKDRCDVQVIQCTIVDNNWGLTNYNKISPGSTTGGGVTTNSHNNIIWGNDITLSMANGSQLFADHNNLGNTNWIGEGNIDVDPLFVNPAGRDYRLSETSPCRGAGRNGADLGARFPVGAPMALSHPRIDAFDVAGGAAVVRFWADSEKTYSVLSSDSVADGMWVKVLDVGLNPVPRYLSVTNLVAPGHRFYRLVTPALP